MGYILYPGLHITYWVNRKGEGGEAELGEGDKSHPTPIPILGDIQGEEYIIFNT